MYAVPCTRFLEIKYHDWRDPIYMSIEAVSVESIMTRGVKCVDQRQSVKAVASIMSTNNIGSVIVTENEDVPVGIITETDIVRIAGLTEAFLPHLLAIDIMSKPVIPIYVESSIQDAIQTMRLNNVRRLPVLDRRAKMVGIITDKDIFRAIINSQLLVSSIIEGATIEHRPIYQRLSEFMIAEMVLPQGSNAN
jgi:CBS domain-containing protein